MIEYKGYIIQIIQRATIVRKGNKFMEFPTEQEAYEWIDLTT